MSRTLDDAGVTSILIADPEVIAIPSHENGESFLDAAAAEIAVDYRLADPPGLFRHARAEVLHRVARAQALLPLGWRFALIEGYRPVETQQRYFDAYLAELAAEHPELEAAQLHRLATRHVAPVLTSGHPPHSTGGAVDLTMLDADGVEVPVGCPVNATPEESDGACYTAAAGLSRSDRANRDVLVDALTQVGLVNYTPEWWHWSYGDQYWALLTGAPTTLYARVPEAAVLADD